MLEEQRRGAGQAAKRRRGGDRAAHAPPDDGPRPQRPHDAADLRGMARQRCRGARRRPAAAAQLERPRPREEDRHAGGARVVGQRALGTEKHDRT